MLVAGELLIEVAGRVGNREFEIFRHPGGDGREEFAVAKNFCGKAEDE